MTTQGLNRTSALFFLAVAAGASLFAQESPTAAAPFVLVTATNAVSGEFQMGGTVTYTIVLTNSGTAAQADNPGNELTDIFPASLTLFGVAANGGMTNFPDAHTLTWNGALAPLGGSVTLQVTATVNAGTGGTTISNQASLAFDADANGTNESSGVSDDPNVGGSSDPTSFTVAPPGPALVTGTMSVGASSYFPGDYVVYDVLLYNSGSSYQLDNAGDEFVDVLPPELEYAGTALSVGTVTETPPGTVRWNGPVPAMRFLSFQILTKIKPGYEGSTVFNQASIFFDSNGGGTNDALNLTDDPAQPGASDPTRFVIRSGLFYTLDPCRLVDTRRPDGPLGGPALTQRQERTFQFPGECNLPATATAVALNVTVTNPGGDGFATLWPDGASLPPTSTLNFSAGQTRANNAVVKLGPSGVVRVVATTSAHLIIDVTGYYH